jgi:hypothetical protein
LFVCLFACRCCSTIEAETNNIKDNDPDTPVDPEKEGKSLKNLSVSRHKYLLLAIFCVAYKSSIEERIRRVDLCGQIAIH